MDNKHQLLSTAIKREHQHQEGDIDLEPNIIDNFSQPAAVTPPKVTVSLPEHAASRLRDLVQRRDIALLRLGIISVQFEDDQIIPLTLNHTPNNSIQPKQQPIFSPPVETIIENPLDVCRQVDDCIESFNQGSITTLTGLSSPTPHDVILEQDEVMETSISTSSSTLQLDPSVKVTSAVAPTEASIISTKSECNSNNLSVVYVDENEDDKDEDEVISEVENQHSSYNIHQLSQLDFTDPIELDLYDTDNLLFPDYTLNLS